MPAGGRRRRRRRRIIGAGAIAVAAAVVAMGTAIDFWPGGGDVTMSGTASRVRIDLLASRDSWALTPRTADASGWCGALVSATAPAHCWTLQDTSYADSTGEWDLSASGSVRAPVSFGFPSLTLAGSVAWDEAGVEFDGATGAMLTAANKDTMPLSAVPNRVSVTFVWRHIGRVANGRVVNHRAGYGWEVYLASTGVVRGVGDGPSGAQSISGATDTRDGLIHCATVVMDDTTTTSSAIYLDGADDTSDSDITGTGGSWYQTSVDFRLGNFSTGNYPLDGGVYRVRVDYTALTLADHQAACRGLYHSSGVNHLEVAQSDLTWSAVSGERCYATGDTTAVCLPAGTPGYAYSATLDASGIPSGMGWVAEPERNNRVTDNWGTACTDTDWTCSTATMDATVAPDGSMTGTAIAMGGGYVEVAATGYTADATVYPRMWARCASGTVTIAHQGGTGSWTVDCTIVAGEWTQLHAAHAAVTVGAGWTATGAGAVTMRLSGADVDIWTPTIAEVDGPSTIRTAGSAATASASVWTLANGDGRWWRNGDRVATTVANESGTCFSGGSTVYLSGYPIACTGVIGRVCAGPGCGASARPWHYELVILAGQSNMTSGATTLAMSADLRDLPPRAELWVRGVAKASVDWGTYYGPEAAIIAAQSGRVRRIYVKRERGGTSLYAAWHPTLDATRYGVTGEDPAYWQYDDLVSDITAADRGIGAPIAVMYWVQGEEDSTCATCGADYADGLDGLILALEADLGREIPILVLGRTYSSLGGAGYTDVRTAQAAIGTARPGGALGGWVDTDALSRYDHVHMTYEGIETLGASMYAAYVTLR